MRQHNTSFESSADSFKRMLGSGITRRALCRTAPAADGCYEQVEHAEPEGRIESDDDCPYGPRRHWRIIRRRDVVSWKRCASHELDCGRMKAWISEGRAPRFGARGDVVEKYEGRLAE